MEGRVVHARPVPRRGCVEAELFYNAPRAPGDVRRADGKWDAKELGQ